MNSRRNRFFAVLAIAMALGGLVAVGGHVDIDLDRPFVATR